MDFLNNIYDFFFSSLLGGLEIKNISELEGFLDYSSTILNVLAWLKLFIPVEVVLLLLSLTTLYYISRFAWAMVKIIRSLIIDNNSLISLFTGFTGGS
jgi:Fe2+ transport system protein B